MGGYPPVGGYPPEGGTPLGGHPPKMVADRSEGVGTRTAYLSRAPEGIHVKSFFRRDPARLAPALPQGRKLPIWGHRFWPARGLPVASPLPPWERARGARRHMRTSHSYPQLRGLSYFRVMASLRLKEAAPS